MGKQLCSNGTMVDDYRYSSPVPVIGLYVAIASLVCFILIIMDVCAGIRRKKSWLPCRFFSLNSITLTLLSVCTKIPVDLTTSMPRAEDQLCKLTGTVFICIAMGFMIPSIGINGEFESYANITALSIFVVTVAVNICIQMATGVIYSFMVEHSIVMFCMLLLIIRYWLAVVDINANKGVYTDQNKDLIRKGEQVMVERLKVCYLHGFQSCPQFLSCKVPYLGHVTLICAACSVILIEAMVRSFVFKSVTFCGGDSDYGWSVWFMVVSQVLTIVTVTLAIAFRWLTFVRHMEENLVAARKLPYEPYIQFLYLFSLADLNLPQPVSMTLEVVFRYLIYYPLHTVDFVMKQSTLIVSKLITTLINKCCGSHEYADRSPMEGFKDLLETHQVVVEEWVLRKGVEDMNRGMEIDPTDDPKNLRDMFNKFGPSQEPLSARLNSGKVISCLSVLILVEIAKISTPCIHVELTLVLDEVFEIVHFIDENIYMGSFKSKLRSMYARVYRKFSLIQKFVDDKKVKKTMKNRVITDNDSARTLGILDEIKQTFVSGVVRDEARDIVNLIHRRCAASRERVPVQIKQLFVDMLHLLLSRLPDAIFNYVLESPIEEYEERVRLGLEFICRFKSIPRIVWVFPSASNIKDLSY